MGKFVNLPVVQQEKGVRQVLEKPCSTCHITKPLEDFPLRKARPDGRGYQCRKCRNEADRVRYIRDREQEIRKSMEWNKTHYERFKENLARYQSKPEVKEKRRPKQAMYQRR